MECRRRDSNPHLLYYGLSSFDIEAGATALPIMSYFGVSIWQPTGLAPANQPRARRGVVADLAASEPVRGYYLGGWVGNLIAELRPYFPSRREESTFIFHAISNIRIILMRVTFINLTL